MSCSPLAEMPLPAMSATDQARRPPTVPRPRASTATSQNASGGQWSNGDLQKPKHLRNASEMSNVTLNLDSGKSSFTSDRSSATSATLGEKRRSGGRAMHKDGSAGRKAESSANLDSNVSYHATRLVHAPRSVPCVKPLKPADVKVPMDEFALDDLVDRLLERPTSESDTRFQNNFLCLYRKFAAPSEVIPLILQKFEDTGKDTTSPHLIRLATQLRSLTILVHWLCEFPGDFAHPTTSMNLSAFAKTIASTPEFAFSSRELLIQLDNLKPDEDTNWACSDKGRGRASTTASFSSVPSLKISLPNTLQEMNLNPSQESIVSSITSTDEQSRHANSTTSLRKPGSRASETSSITSSFMDRDAALSSSSANFASQHEISQRHANMLLRQTRMSLTEEHWHEFMGFDNSVIAKELTRIDWIMFSAVRPRDLIRHINLSGEERANCKGLEHVDRMIAHFNHVASWVGQMILLRDKPKHRSRMLEKCMAIAWKLRQMNNYNGVGAFVAGISNVAISRLQQTKALVDVSITKTFMKLDILMGMSKGYSAYRLAWNNTSGEKIPFLPLHRHDLVVAEEGSPTFANSEKTLINWTKFDTMGRSLWDIQKAQKMHYTGLARNPDVQRLIMEGRVGEDIDDMLYDRSLQLEPGPRQKQDQERRWSHWLR